jgi:hypothetical protein
VGFEDYQLKVRFEPALHNVVEDLLRQKAVADLNVGEAAPASYCEIAGADFLLEVELSSRDRWQQASIRFALCQPAGALDAAIDLAGEIVAAVDGELQVAEHPQHGGRWYGAVDEASVASAREAYAEKHTLWVREVGSRIAILRCADAVESFVSAESVS